jgi:hypothetical protein
MLRRSDAVGTNARALCAARGIWHGTFMAFHQMFGVTWQVAASDAAAQFARNYRSD